ncbi:hypothetical protein FLONG3_7486 [Fusarium longipes]|uniref:Uncharacterized protein n=1 Tax=Fusarium longipes TaxID=694270 RepID=A0A395SD24_9HYPO|nr:hypothetical protein FLONG3_7486 [Fusarium longipes]
MDSASTAEKTSRRSGERIFKRTKTCDIPNLTHLRKELGYGTPGKKPDIIFKRAIRTQVTTFVSSSDNLPAYKLTKWKNPAHQRGLLELTKDFLEGQGKGEAFWPRDQSNHPQKLQYWRDAVKIRNLMTKLFFCVARECKRYIISVSGDPQMLREPLSPIKSEETLSDSDLSWRIIFDGKGQSADDAIDLEDTQTSVRISGSSRDNDPWNGYALLPYGNQGETGNQPTEAVFDSSVSELLNDANIQSTAPSEPVNPQAPVADMDPYTVPPSPPQGTQNGQDINKRPAEPTPNDSEPPLKKKTRGKGKQAAKSNNKLTNPKSLRKSGRLLKPIINPDSSTEEQVDAAIRGSPYPVPKYNSYAEQGERSRGKADGQGPRASSSRSRSTAALESLTDEQPTAQAAREEAARQAREQTEAIATGAGIEGQAPAETGLSATTRGKQPAVPSRQTTVVEAAASSREQDMVVESFPRTETDALQMNPLQTTAPITSGIGGTDPDEQERDPGRVTIGKRYEEALDACKIVYRFGVKAGTRYTDWELKTFDGTIFRTTIAAIFQKLGLGDSETLHVKFEDEDDAFLQQFRKSETGEREFATFGEECLRYIAKKHQYSAPDSMRQKASYFFYLSSKPSNV